MKTDPIKILLDNKWTEISPGRWKHPLLPNKMETRSAINLQTHLTEGIKHIVNCSTQGCNNKYVDVKSNRINTCFYCSVKAPERENKKGRQFISTHVKISVRDNIKILAESQNLTMTDYLEKLIDREMEALNNETGS